ncbi:Ig-like domain-containing protein, partial [Microvirga sp. 0TCS3.31]
KAPCFCASKDQPSQHAAPDAVSLALTFSTATVKILVVGNNDKPIGNADIFDIDPNKAFTDSVLTNDADIDVGDTLTASLVSGPANGTLDLKADGSFTYTPKADYYRNDTFVYRAYDGKEYSDPVTVTLQGKGEPLKTTFGASKGGVIYEDRYSPGDHYRYSYDYNSFAEAQGHQDRIIYAADQTIYNTKALYETSSLFAGTNFYHVSGINPGTTYSLGVDAAGNEMNYFYSHDVQQNSTNIYEALIEFDVSGGIGLVSGATFKFDSASNHGYDSHQPWPDHYPSTLSFDVYVYSGDDAITLADSGAGTLAGEVTVSNVYRDGNNSTYQSAVSLDADAINAILSSGSDHVGIRLVSDETDHWSGSGSAQNYEFLQNINVSTASLEFFYV